jgi:hypothetical protein
MKQIKLLTFSEKKKEKKKKIPVGRRSYNDTSQREILVKKRLRGSVATNDLICD